MDLCFNQCANLRLDLVNAIFLRQLLVWNATNQPFCQIKSLKNRWLQKQTQVCPCLTHKLTFVTMDQSQVLTV